MFGRLKYNVLALLGAGLGMINSAIIWKIFGTTAQADAWLVTTAMTAILGLLSLCSVEQYLVFAAEAETSSPQFADQFLRTATMWSLLFGLGFYIACLALSRPLIDLFVSRSAQEVRDIARQVIAMQLLPLLSMPLTYVARQHNNLKGAFGKAYLISLALQASVCVVQIAYLLTNQSSIQLLAYGIGVASAIQLAVSATAMKQGFSVGKFVPRDFFFKFIKNSFSMRAGHSLHNFLSGVIFNNAFSTLGPGSIAIFQYAKKFSDGISAVAVGPQASIYLSRLTNKWVSKEKSISVRSDILSYIRITAPLLSILIITTAASISIVFDLLARNPGTSSTEAITNLFLVLSVWQAIIFLESIFTAVLTIVKQSYVFWTINALFIVVLYGLLQTPWGGHNSYTIAASGCVAQLLSISLYGYAARKAILRRNHVT